MGKWKNAWMVEWDDKMFAIYFTCHEMLILQKLVYN